eukprot:8986743-Alexandrium_andersonii.AAC.1
MTPQRSRPRRSASRPSSTAPPKPRSTSSPRGASAMCSGATLSFTANTVPRRSSRRASSCP